MKVIIIDDEKSMHIIMERMLKKINPITLIGCFFDTWSAYDFLVGHEVDIIFIDISMPKESGLEFAKRLRDEGRETKIIFVTSHKEYALPAFDVYAFDYIVKPVNQARLQHTIGRLFSELEKLQNKKLEHAHAPKLLFNCLGLMELRTDTNELVKWKTSKSTELFAYLIMQRGKRVSRARIIEDIFAHLPLKNAETYLNTTVYQLRKLLSNYGLNNIVYSDNQYYALEYTQIAIDAIQFEEKCQQFEFTNDAQIKLALEHEKSYYGNLFGEEVYQWAQNDVERYFLMYISFSHKLCEALMKKSEIDSAIQLLKKLIDNYELEDKTMMLYLEALALKNDELGLKRQYKVFKELVKEEMGINLSQKVTNYYQELIVKMN